MHTARDKCLLTWTSEEFWNVTVSRWWRQPDGRERLFSVSFACTSKCRNSDEAGDDVLDELLKNRILAPCWLCTLLYPNMYQHYGFGVWFKTILLFSSSCGLSRSRLGLGSWNHLCFRLCFVRSRFYSTFCTFWAIWTPCIPAYTFFGQSECTSRESTNCAVCEPVHQLLTDAVQTPVAANTQSYKYTKHKEQKHTFFNMWHVQSRPGWWWPVGATCTASGSSSTGIL